MEHIEQAGIHSGDSACVIPSFSLSPKVLETIKSATKSMARELAGPRPHERAVRREGRRGLRPRSEPPRLPAPVPFVSKAIRQTAGQTGRQDHGRLRTLRTLGFTEEIMPPHFSVKEACSLHQIPWRGYHARAGEMRSTGEVMGIDADLGIACGEGPDVRAAAAADQGQHLHQREGFRTNPLMVPIAKEFAGTGFHHLRHRRHRRCC